VCVCAHILNIWYHILYQSVIVLHFMWYVLYTAEVKSIVIFFTSLVQSMLYHVGRADPEEGGPSVAGVVQELTP